MAQPLLDLGRRLLEDFTPERIEAYALAHPDEIDLIAAALADPDLERYAIGRRYQDDPNGWVARRLSEGLWSKQREILESVRDNRYTVVPSCHGVGKSFVASRAVGWWLEAHPPGTAYVVSTAPTGDQVRGVLWREINRMHTKGDLPGRVNLSQWYFGNQLVAVGRKPSNTNPAAFQGQHAEYMLVIIDEADGVDERIFDAAADTLATNANARVLAIGNPDRSTGPFHKACLPGSEWHMIRISAFDSPAFTGEVVDPHLLTVLVSSEWVEERRRKWGEADPRWSSKVLGKAPPSNPDATIPYGPLVDCMTVEDPTDYLDAGGPAPLYTTEGRLVGYDWTTIPELPHWGIDVGAGGDRTVVWERRGRFLARRFQIVTADSEEQADAIVQLVAEWGQPDTIHIDKTGVGWALAGRLKRLCRTKGHLLHGTLVDAVGFGEGGSPPTAPHGNGTGSPGFRCVRDELWWHGRELTKSGGWDLRSLTSPEHGFPDLDDDVTSELIDPKWDNLGSGGRIRVEAKAHTIRRLGRSPDDADALLLAFWPGKTRRGKAPSTDALAGISS